MIKSVAITGEKEKMNSYPNENIIIEENEISQYTQRLFTISSSQIIGKTNPFKGERAFVLCSLEQIIGLLSLDNKNDKMIIQHTKNLLHASHNIQE